MHLSQLNLYQVGHRTWASDVQCMLHNSSVSDIWESQLPDPNVAKHIKKHMELFYQDFLTQEIYNSFQNPNLRFYKQIKKKSLLNPISISVLQNTDNHLANFASVPITLK